MIRRKCAQCGKHIGKDKRRDAKYCSTYCHDKALRQRKQAAAQREAMQRLALLLRLRAAKQGALTLSQVIEGVAAARPTGPLSRYPQPSFSMREFLTSDKWLGAQFGGPSWEPHRILLCGAMGEELDERECAIFKKFTKRTYAPGIRVALLEIVGGRQFGKTRCAAACLCYFAVAFPDLRYRLPPGATAVIGLMSPTKNQSGKVYEYVLGNFNNVESLKPYIKSVTREEILLTNQISIQISSADHKTIRGGQAWLYIFDELGFFPTDEQGSTSDRKIMDAAIPALSMLNGMCIAISTPWIKKGELWDIYKENFREDGDPECIVACGSTLDYNPLVDPKFIERLKKRGESYNNEVLGQFRTDVGSFISRDLIESLVLDYEMLPPSKHIHYSFSDMSGGAGGDAAVTCIGHEESTSEGTIIVIDRLIETVPPFNCKDMVAAHSAALKEYNCWATTGDKFGGDTYHQMFYDDHDIDYKFTTLTKNELYTLALPYLTSRRVRLPNCPKLIEQFCDLEMRTARGSNRMSIDHPQGARFHDDLPNAVVGLINVLASDRNLFAEAAAKEGFGPAEQSVRDHINSLGRTSTMTFSPSF